MANPTKAVTSSKLTPRLQFSCTHINRTCVFKRMGGSLGGRKNKCTHLKNVCCTINTRKNNCFVESLGASLKEFFLFSYSNWSPHTFTHTHGHSHVDTHTHPDAVRKVEATSQKEGEGFIASAGWFRQVPESNASQNASHTHTHTHTHTHKQWPCVYWNQLLIVGLNPNKTGASSFAVCLFEQLTMLANRVIRQVPFQFLAWYKYPRNTQCQA